MENHYKHYTDEIRKLYEAFIESGFDEEQALIFTSAYVNQSAMENVFRNIRIRDTEPDRQRLRRAFSKTSE